jgi:hypothetical protein
MKKLALALALTLPAAAATLPKNLPRVCAQFQKDGWTAPNDPTSGKPMMAEMSVPGVMYLCTLQRVLPRASGTGHPPDIQALISNDGTTNSIILDANIWCEPDQAPTLDALAKQLSQVLGTPLPDPVAAAIRGAKNLKTTADGLDYVVESIPVDATACRDVPAGRLGPVLLKVDVVVKAAR